MTLTIQDLGALGEPLGAVARMGSGLGVETPFNTFITTALGLSAGGREQHPPP